MREILAVQKMTALYNEVRRDGGRPMPKDKYGVGSAVEKTVKFSDVLAIAIKKVEGTAV